MSDTLRVAMLIQGYYPRIGGAERQLAALAPLLQQQGVELHVLTRRYPGLAAYELVQGVPVHRLPIPGPKPVASLSFTLAALALLRRLRPDVIHAHELLSPTTTALAARRLFGVPVVAKVLRGGSLGDLARVRQKPLASRRIASMRDQVDAFVAISAEIDAELEAIGVPPARRLRIPNGVDTQRFAPPAAAERQALRARLGLPDLQAPVVVFSGRLAPEKRVEDLLAAWAAIHSQHPEALLLVLGSGPQEQLLRQMASPQVRFVGAVDNVAPYLQAADLFVLPSEAEGLSNALLEALACGLPAIATAVGGAPDLIAHGQSGWLVPPGAPQALQQALQTLLGDPGLRQSLGQQARQLVAREYALRVVASRLRALYEQLRGESLLQQTGVGKQLKP